MSYLRDDVVFVLPRAVPKEPNHTSVLEDPGVFDASKCEALRGEADVTHRHGPVPGHPGFEPLVYIEPWLTTQYDSSVVLVFDGQGLVPEDWINRLFISRLLKPNSDGLVGHPLGAHAHRLRMSPHAQPHLDGGVLPTGAICSQTYVLHGSPRETLQGNLTTR